MQLIHELGDAKDAIKKNFHVIVDAKIVQVELMSAEVFDAMDATKLLDDS